MTRRSAEALVLIIALAAAGLWYARTRSARQDLPAGSLNGYNVLLISIDTLRADHLGSYGSRQGLTPALDRLAREGARFETAYAHVPLTLPSHASLLTGALPTRHGVRDNGTFRLDDAVPTLATHLDAAGYDTAAFVGAFVLDARFGLARGFDLYDDYYGEQSTPGRSTVVERPADRVVDAAVRWIESRQTRWFAWVHLYDPHEPYAPPEPFASRYLQSPYAGEVAYADSVIGRMVDRLANGGRLPRTIVVVTADHGESLGEHGERTHGLFAYDSTLRVPLILWAPDRVRPGSYTAPARIVDITPTVLDLVGVRTEAGDGRSLRTVITREEPADADVPVYFEALNANLTRNWAPLTGIAANNLKLIDLPVPELYDLRVDPGETQNVYARRPDEARRLEATLDRVTASAVPLRSQGVDVETANRLRSLGYVVSPAPSARKRFTAADDPKNLVGLNAALDEAMTTAERDPERAIATLREAIRKRPDLTLAYDRLAFVQRGSGRAADAIATLEEAAARGIADAPLLVSLGSALQETGDLARSAAVLEAAVQLNPQDVEARNRLGTTYARMRRAADAERLFREVLEGDPRSSETLANLGVLYLSTARPNEAIAILRTAVEADPAHTGARNTLAVAYAKTGNLTGAVHQWREGLAVNPNQPDALYNLGTALVQLGRGEEAVPVLERFITIAPPQYESDVSRVKQIIAAARR